jgi:Tol biopolymer transport system component/tRNA A-37 threonylcarbamoyl transferase component Bud32
MTDVDRLKSALDNRYTVERELGAGGMATVYLAHDTKHHRKVAVKVLRPELAASLGAERFHREIEVAARLQHPHILPLLDSGEAEGVLYYMMPFIEGESLRERLSRQGELPVHEAVRILVEIVDALAHAHARGVVHRDIKPDNVMLSGRHALVTDFGVAKAVSEATGRQKLTTAGIALGTPAYMAPEQATADPHIDHRVDIYAVGALAYELLTGRPPFAGLTPQETLAAHVTMAPEPVRKHRATISPGLNDVVMRCLEKRPADRWQSADALLAELEQQLTPSTGMTPAQTQSAKAIAVRRSRMVWLGAIVGVAALGAFAVRMMPRGGGAPLSLGRAQPLAYDATLEIDPDISPDGRYVAYAAGPLNRTRVYVRQLGGRAIPVTNDSTTIQRRPQWSPDGTQLLFSQANDLVVAPALGGNPRIVVRRVRRAGEPPIVSAAWSPDGQRVAYVVEDSLYVQPLAGGSPRLLVAGQTMFSIDWSRDGRYLAYVAGDARFAVAGAQFYGNVAPSEIRTIAVEGGAPIVVTDRKSMNVSPAWMPDGKRLLFVTDRDGPRDVYAVESSAGKPRGVPVRVTSGLNPHSISVAADGSRIAYSAYISRSNIWGLPLRPGGVATMADAHQITTGNQYIEGVTISADGRSLYYDSDRDGTIDVYRIAIAGGEPERITVDHAPKYNPIESPDGRWVAFHSFKYGNRDIFVVPREGGEPIRVTDDSTHEQLPQWAPDSRAIGFFRHGFGQRPTAYVVRRRPDGSWGEPELVAPMTAAPRWLNDSTMLVQRFDGGIDMLFPRSGARRPFYEPSAAPLPAFGGAMTVWDGGIVIRTYDAEGASSFWRFTRPGNTPRLIARLNDLNRPAARSEFDTDGRFLYFTIADRQSDVFVAELLKR